MRWDRGARRLLVRLMRALQRRVGRLADRLEAGGVMDSDSGQAPLRQRGGPPAHWLELVRRHAPQLLSPDAARQLPSEPAWPGYGQPLPVERPGPRNPVAASARRVPPGPAPAPQQAASVTPLPTRSADIRGSRSPGPSPSIEPATAKAGPALCEPVGQRPVVRSGARRSTPVEHRRRGVSAVPPDRQPRSAAEPPAAGDRTMPAPSSARPKPPADLGAVSVESSRPEAGDSNPGRGPSARAVAPPPVADAEVLSAGPQGPDGTGFCTAAAAAFPSGAPRRTDGCQEPSSEGVAAFRYDRSDVAAPAPWSALPRSTAAVAASGDPARDAPWPRLPDTPEPASEGGGPSLDRWPPLPDEAPADPSPAQLATVARAMQRQHWLDREQRGELWNA